MVQVCFYADDFTGGTASLSAFRRAGLNTKMFLGVPALEEAMAEGADVIGIAGVSRSLGPDAMRAELLPVFDLFAALGAPIIQYKFCSTFDSSPDIGNLAVVIEVAKGRLGTTGIPVVPACPVFGRYTAFGTHFASHKGAVYALDEHPVMMRHPVTPMTDANLARILTAQGPVSIAGVDLRVMESGTSEVAEAWSALQQADAVIFDATTRGHLDAIAEAICDRASGDHVVTLAAQELSGALGRRLVRNLGRVPEATAVPSSVERLLVLSGSASPWNASQIDAALATGRFEEIAIDVDLLCQPDGPAKSFAAIEPRLTRLWESKAGIIVHSARGPDDARLAGPRADLNPLLAALFIRLLTTACGEQGLRRAMLAGGDTSSWTMRQCGASAMRFLAPIAGGGNLCKLEGGLLDGLEVILKGGQVGAQEVMSRALDGENRGMVQ